MSEVVSKSAARKDKTSYTKDTNKEAASGSNKSSSKGEGSSSSSSSNRRKRAAGGSMDDHRSASGAEAAAAAGKVAELKDSRGHRTSDAGSMSRHHAAGGSAGHKSGRDHGRAADDHHNRDDHGVTRAKQARRHGPSAQDAQQHHQHQQQQPQQQHRFAMFPSSPAAAAAAGLQHQAQLDQHAQYHAAQLQQQYMQLHSQMMMMQSQAFQQQVPDPSAIGAAAAVQPAASRQSREFDETNVYVAHLPMTMTHEEFFQLMSRFGTVVSSRVLVGDHWRKKGVKGVGFARMGTEAEALAAVRGVNNLKVLGNDSVLRARLAFKTVRVGGGQQDGEDNGPIGGYADLDGQQAAVAAATALEYTAAAAAAGLPYGILPPAAVAVPGASADVYAGTYGSPRGSPYYDPLAAASAAGLVDAATAAAAAAAGYQLPQPAAGQAEWAQLGQVDAATAAAAAAAAAMAHQTSVGYAAVSSHNAAGSMMYGVTDYPTADGGVAPDYVAAAGGSQSPAFTWDDVYGGITATDPQMNPSAYQNFGTVPAHPATHADYSALTNVIQPRTRRPGSSSIIETNQQQNKKPNKIIITAPPPDDGKANTDLITTIKQEDVTEDEPSYVSEGQNFSLAVAAASN